MGTTKHLLAPLRDLRDRRQLAPFSQTNPDLAILIRAVRREGLTFLSAGALSDLAEAMLAIERAGVAGDVIEAGAALGGSSIVLGAAKDSTRAMTVYDTFGLIPPPTERDGQDVHDRYAVIEAGEAKGIAGAIYYGYRPDLLSEVQASFRRHGIDAKCVRFVQGLYEDSLRVERPVALAHIDCDWYDSVTTCLERIEPHIVVGGRFIIDDYYAWSGARDAVDEFFAGRTEYRWVKERRLHLIRTK